LTTPERTTLLIAEDDAGILELITFRLGLAEYEILKATNGAEALRLATEHVPDLAVLDIMMPELDGLEVTRRIRANEITSRMPVILLTANVQEEDVSRGFDAGADDYMKKPFSPQELLSRVQAILGRR
jgi:DNA-binding response OmpR family regulator